MDKPFIVKLNESDKYFQVEYYLTTIINITFTKHKKRATVFQDAGNEITFPNGKNKISVNKERLKQLAFILHNKGITKDQITKEEVCRQPTPFFSDAQIKEASKFITTLKKSKCR